MLSRASTSPTILLMSPTEFLLALAAIAVAAGLLGSLVGLGGGIIIVPVLTLLFHINIRLAIGASIVSVIATSSGAAITYVRQHLSNIRAGMFLEIGTTLGAISGAYVATLVSNRFLFLLFAIVLLYSASTMLKKRHHDVVLRQSSDKLANYFRLHGEYYDARDKKKIRYKVTHTPIGLGCMYVAGIVSALLGVGSGTLKVPAMDVAMHMPVKASAATSDFMIGVTAAASAGAYFARGQIDPYIAAPVAIGVLVGALVGSQLLNRISARAIRYAFIVVLFVVAAEMLQRGIAA